MKWETLKDSSLSEIIRWAESQAWCSAMSQCVQDAHWHSEGDVWTHTKRVLEQLVSLNEWTSLTSRERVVLTFTALFHDVAKPITTEVDPETGRVTSPKHAVQGEHVARRLLREIGCDLPIREEIARMVRYHGRPNFLGERDNPIQEVVRMSWLVSNRLLYLFAIADTRGRDTESMNRPEENLHYWKMLAEELDCFQSPYSFQNNHARFVYFRQKAPDLLYVPYEEFRCTVTLISGLPGSGKDSWLAKNRPELPIVSLDILREELSVEPTDNQGTIAQLAQERCRELLRDRASFAFNATNTMRLTRARWLDLFSQYNAQIEIVYLEPSFETILSQNKGRENQVPEHVIRKLANRCEPPTWLECHSLFLFG